MPTIRQRNRPFETRAASCRSNVRIQIEYAHIDKLLPPWRQLKMHPPKHIDRIASNMQRRGVLVPLVVSADYRIVSGMGRYLAGKKLGMDELPVVRADHLSDDELRSFAIADNQLARSDFDMDVLRVELGELIMLDDVMPIELTGFDTVEIDNILMSSDEIETEDRELEDLHPVAILGDLFRLGDHILLCSNSEDPESYRTLLGDECVRMVFSDNPYNVKIKGNVSGLGSVTHGEFVMASGEMSKERFTSFLTNVFRNCASVSLDGAIHFQWIDHRHLREMMDAGEAVYEEMKNLIVWDKQKAGMGSFYRSQQELAFVWKVGKAPHVNNFGLGGTGRHRSNVWSYPGANKMRRGRLDELAMHPTVKNLTMVTDAIRDVSNRGDLVLDPFCGSGTTIMAAERCGRRARCIELDPQYVDVAIRRWEKVTKMSAIHVASGLRFSDLTIERQSEMEGLDHD